METIIKEKEVIHDEVMEDGVEAIFGRSECRSYPRNHRHGRCCSYCRQGGIFGNGGLLGGSAPASGSGSVTLQRKFSCNMHSTLTSVRTFSMSPKGMYDLAIAGQATAAKAREIDVAEKFGLYVNNRDNIDRVNGRINDELFSLYKYTRQGR